MSQDPSAAAGAASTTSKKGTIFIIYYSVYGHVYSMVQEVMKGIKEQGSFEVEAYTMPDARADPKTAPHNMQCKRIFTTAEDRQAFIDKQKTDNTGVNVEGHILVADLAKADAFMFGIPTRFGMLPGKFKSLLDNTASLWFAGEGLYGKPASIFFSTGSQGGGQETTALTFVTQLVHHGMIYVPIGYGKTFGPILMNLEAIHGGSPYGSGMIAAPDGSRQISDLEKKLATAQGNYFAGVAKKFL